MAAVALQANADFLARFICRLLISNSFRISAQFQTELPMSTQANSPLTDTTSVQAVSRYTRTAMVLHWIIALLIICNVALGLSADSLPDDWVRPVIDTHKSIGITVLGLVLLRILRISCFIC
jgi:hypothetical protein